MFVSQFRPVACDRLIAGQRAVPSGGRNTAAASYILRMFLYFGLGRARRSFKVTQLLGYRVSCTHLDEAVL